MRLENGQRLRAAPAVLTAFTACDDASRLVIDRVFGCAVPEGGGDPEADLLAELDRRHETACLDHLGVFGPRVERMDPFAEGAADRFRAKAVALASPWLCSMLRSSSSGLNTVDARARLARHGSSTFHTVHP